MGITITNEPLNNIVITVDGLLTFNDQKAAESCISAEIDGRHTVRLLVMAEKLAGWGKQGDWGDMTFMHQHDPYIEKIALVSHPKWRDEILMYTGAGMRQAKVEFFPVGDEEKARDWLQGED